MTDVVSPLEKSQNICVYCGSSSGNGPEFAAEAIALGRALATQNLGLVYGGGRVGLMGLVADAVLDNDGSTRHHPRTSGEGRNRSSRSHDLRNGGDDARA